jgi:acetyl esterase
VLTAGLAAALAAERAQLRGVSDHLNAEFGAALRADVGVSRVAVGPDAVAVDAYRPGGLRDAAGAYVFLHGGAFWHGSIDEGVNRALIAERAARAEVAAFAIEYRLAPEHPFPAAAQDAENVIRWVREGAASLGVDPARIVLGGVSAGANIALAAAARLRRGELAGLLLEVPAIDLRDNGTWDARWAAVNGLGAPSEMADLYGGGLPPASAEVSPLLLPDLSGLPATHVMTAEYDPLRAGGEALVRRLRAAGVAATGARHFGVLHGVPGLTANNPPGAAWSDDACAAIRRLSAQDPAHQTAQRPR